MFIYDTKAQRLMVQEHMDQLAQDLRRVPDPAGSGVERSRRAQRIARVMGLLQLRMRRSHRARLRARAFDL